MTRLLLGLCALGLSATYAAGQEPIVALKVTPEQSVFKNAAWHKPIVLKSHSVLVAPRCHRRYSCAQLDTM